MSKRAVAWASAVVCWAAPLRLSPGWGPGPTAPAAPAATVGSVSRSCLVATRRSLVAAASATGSSTRRGAGATAEPEIAPDSGIAASGTHRRRPGARRVASLVGRQHPVPDRGQRLRHPDPAGGGLREPMQQYDRLPRGRPGRRVSNTSPRARSRSRCISIAPLGMPARVAARLDPETGLVCFGRSTCFPRPSGG